MRTTLAERDRGFTLIEIAVGLIVVFAFLGFVLVPMSSFLQSNRINENQRALELIRNRLIEFVTQNGRLPCPAQPDLAAGPGLGIEWVKREGTRLTCEGTGAAYPGGANESPATGVVPWVTLRVPEDDAWGRRFTYSVDRSWAEVDPDCNPIGTPTQTGCSRIATTWIPLNVSVRQFPGAAGLQINQSQLAAVVVSHGPNGLGGYASDGTAAIAPPANSDESSNRLQMPSATTVARLRDFRTRLPSPDQSTCDDVGSGPLCGFDDQIVTISQSLLALRMLQAGHLR